MDNKQKLEELYEKKRKMESRMKELNADIEEYNEKASAGEDSREKAFSEYLQSAGGAELEELSQEYDKLIEQIDKLEDIIEKEDIDQAKQRCVEIDKKIQTLEEEIQKTAEEVKKALEEIQVINKQVYDLKATEEYKNGDPETLDKVAKLEAEIDAKVEQKDKVSQRLKTIREEINGLEKEKNELVEKYGEEILPIQEITRDEQEPAEGVNKPEQEAQSVADQVVENKTEEVGNNKPKQNKKVQQPVYATNVPGSKEVPEKGQEENTQNDPKVEFKALYKKCKEGTLDYKEYSRLAEIMNDPENYDKLGITTGVIFNKSKVILKAMATKASRTDGLIGEIESKLGIKLEKPNKENGLMSTRRLRDADGIKRLQEDPEQKLAAEELYKQVMEMDRDTLDPEQQKVWDRAKEQLGYITALRSAIKVNGDVINERKQKRFSWLFEEQETPARLDEAKEAKEPKKSLGDELASKTEPDTVSYEPGISIKHRSKDDPVK